MPTLTVTTDTDYRTAPNNVFVTGQNITAITFATSGFLFATFDTSQFGGSNIANNVLITGDAQQNNLYIAGVPGMTSFSAAGWTFATWNPGDTTYFEDVAGNQSWTGSSQEDAFLDSAGDDTYIGGAGNDSFYFSPFNGSNGNDSIDGGAGTQDSVDYKDQTQGVIVNIAAGTASGAGIGSDVFTGIENVFGGAGADMLIGDAGVNALDGGAGNDTLDGGAGFDQMAGGGGDDTYYVDGTGESVYEYDANVTTGGYDTIISSVNFSLTSTSYVERLVLTGAAPGGAGNQLDNVIDARAVTGTVSLQGKGGNDLIYGGVGADQILGDANNDTLDGGAGNDLINGGDGDDWIVYDVADSAAQVTGGTGTDMLWVVGGSAPTGFNLVAQGFESARHDITDTTNQAWSQIFDTYSATWQRITSDIRFDNGTRQVRNFDHLNNQSYSEFINQQLDIANPNSQTKQVILFDNSTRQERFFDYLNNQTYSEYINDYSDAANSGTVTRQVIIADNGTKQERFFDYLSNQNYVEYINDYADAAQPGSVTRQIIVFDNGIKHERFFDYLNNQPAYSEYINVYNAAGQITRQVGFNNAGQQAWEYFY